MLNTHMRKNYKLYDPDYVVGEYIIKRLDECVAGAPTQLDSSSDRFGVIKSSSIDLARHTIVPLLFGNTRLKLFEAAPLTSSLVYYFTEHHNDGSPWHPLLHIGITSGMLVSRALELGLDASFIACQWDTVDNKQVNKLLHDNYAIPPKVKLKVKMVVCIGRGIEPDNLKQQQLKLLTGQTVEYSNSITHRGPKPTHYL